MSDLASRDFIEIEYAIAKRNLAWHEAQCAIDASLALAPILKNPKSQVSVSFFPHIKVTSSRAARLTLKVTWTSAARSREVSGDRNIEELLVWDREEKLLRRRSERLGRQRLRQALSTETRRDGQ